MTNFRAKKTLEEAIGKESASMLIQCILERRSFVEIAKLMPFTFKSNGAVAGITFRHKVEIAERKKEYLSKHPSVQPLGTSRPFQGTPKWRHGQKFTERQIIEQALREWRPASGFKQNAFAAMQVNKSRISYGVRTTINADEVALIIRNFD